MKPRVLVIATLLILIALAAFAFYTSGTIQDKSISGIRIRSELWRGTITVTDDVFALPWVTLTLDPGTQVRFEKKPDVVGTDWTKYADAYITDHNDPTGKAGYGRTHFSIWGKVIARGTADEPIVLTSAQETPDYADWDQLILRSGSILDNVEVAYAHNGVNIDGKGVTIRNSKIHDSLWSCIDIFSTGTTIENNEIYHCWHQAVGVKVTGPNTISGNRIHDAQLSVNCENGADPIITKNAIAAAPLNQECPASNDNTEVPGIPDTAGGTYGGRLIYPSSQ